MAILSSVADSAAIKAAQDAWEAHSISVADVEDYEDQLLKWVMQLREQLGMPSALWRARW